MFWLGAVASLLAGLGTTLGALAVFLLRRPSKQALIMLISGAAGVMLAASFFALLEPAMRYAKAHAPSAGVGVLVVIAGVFIGAAALRYIHARVPHEHFTRGREGPLSDRFARLWLFVIAISLHNVPEGMAVGVGFAEGNIANGVALGLAIGLQNVPEGLAVSVSMLAAGYRRLTAFGVGSLTGLVEPVGGVVGAAGVAFVQPGIPLIMSMAAGAMLYVISEEIIPETHRDAENTLATFALLAGVAVMLVLDAVLEHGH